MQALLMVIATWLSVNFDLPAFHDHPRAEFASAAKMAAVRYSRLGPMQPDRAAAETGRSAPPDVEQDVYAIYDDISRTIYLREGWTGATPTEVSVLVHELVHHLQNAAGMKFSCPQEREKDAYKAQRAWLGLFGRTLKQEFEIDSFTVLVRTNCLH